MSPAEVARFDDLVSRYLDDTLTDAAAADLVALLSEPPLAMRFLEMTRLNSEIAGLLAAPVPDAAMVELIRSDLEKSLAHEPNTDGVGLHVVAPARPPASAYRIVLRQRKPAWRALAWAAVFFAFAGLAAFFLVNQVRQVNPPVIVSAQGEVRLVGPAGEHVFIAGESWQRDERLKTIGPNSAATVRFNDGSQLGFGGNTIAVNESGKAGRRVGLVHGVIQAVVEKSARSAFIFVTPEAEAIVVGTKLRLVAGGHSTRLEVTEGEVRVRRRHDGAVVTLKAGHYAIVAPYIPLEAISIHPEPHHIQ